MAEGRDKNHDDMEFLDAWEAMNQEENRPLTRQEKKLMRKAEKQHGKLRAQAGKLEAKRRKREAKEAAKQAKIDAKNAKRQAEIEAREWTRPQSVPDYYVLIDNESDKIITNNNEKIEVLTEGE
jgi:hypothetical protein